MTMTFKVKDKKTLEKAERCERRLQLRPVGQGLNHHRHKVRRRQFLAAAGVCFSFVGSAFAEAPQQRAFGPNEGEVIAVDREAGEIIIRHGPLPELDMPAMAMAFNVADPKFFSEVRKGDRVRFQVGLVQGRFAITSIERLQAPEKR